MRLGHVLIDHLGSTMSSANAEMIRDLLPLAGNLVLDVGCGDGAMVRLMTRAGAQVIGLDCNAEQLTKARTSEAAGDETYMEGLGEDIPLIKNSVDVVLFFNSLHHIPVPEQAKALQEAHRVLQAMGTLAIFEPLAEGPHFELNKPVDDETFVRAAAFRALKKAPEIGFVETRELVYDQIVTYPAFAAFREKCLRIDPGRKDVLLGVENDLRKTFTDLAETVEGGFGFVQPMRANIFQKF